jgi:transposase
MVFGMRCSGWNCLGKKTPGYKERDPHQRKAYLRLRERYHRRGKVFVYIDESGFAPSVTRRYAYAPKGQRTPGLISGIRRPRTSLLAARMGKSFDAPFLFEGTCNAQVFNGWLEHALCPLLTPTHVVVMDNVPFHKSAHTRDLISHTGATLLFLPPYSPDLNPIEHDFATLKKLREYNEQVSLDDLIKTYK